MEFTSNNILSLLEQYRGRPYIQSAKRYVYHWVALLPDDISHMQPDILYVCRLSEALQRNQAKPECHFVCICDRYLSDEEHEDEKMLRNIILIEENWSISRLLNLIQERFFTLEKWDHEMKDALLQGGDYQQLLDISEKYLKNSLFVLDGAYRLVACSKNYVSNEPICVSLYEHGYHVQETMQKFYDHDRFSVYEKNHGIIPGEPGVIAQCETLSKLLRHCGVPLIHVVEMFNYNPITAESEELFDRMMYYINLCFLREQKNNQELSQPYENFMRDMIYGGLEDVQQIEGYAKRTNVPIHGHFNVYKIVFKDNGKVLIGRFAQELSTLLNDAKIIIKDYEINVMNIYQKPNVEALSQRNIDYIMPLLQKHNAELGVSVPFQNLYELPYACNQAAHAIACGHRISSHTLRVRENECASHDSIRCTLRAREKECASHDSIRCTLRARGNECASHDVIRCKNENDAQYENVYHYNDMFLFHMIHLSSSGAFDVFHNNTYLQKIQKLEEYDQEHATKLSKLLYFYLYYERKATETGNYLHMHRNTVMYHIVRVRNLLDIDLDDYITRQGLLIAFHYMQYDKD